MSTKDWNLEEHTILRVTHGSHAYGLAGPGSDMDTRGVAIAPLSSYLGTRAPWEQTEDKITDTVIWDIRKFLRLAGGGNPNVLEILFVPGECVRKVTSLGQVLLSNRDMFLSLKCKGAMLEYAKSQFEKARKHRTWLQMTEEEIRDFLCDPAGDPDQKKSFRKWQTERTDKTRAREEKCGYDSKHMSHCFRLLEQSMILFRTGRMVVRLDEETRKRVLAIKQGEMEFDTLLRDYGVLYEAAHEAARENKAGLPEEPDHERISELSTAMIKRFHNIP